MTALLGVGDWTGDGLADLLARNTAGEMRLFRGSGSAGGRLLGARRDHVLIGRSTYR